MEGKGSQIKNEVAISAGGGHDKKEGAPPEKKPLAGKKKNHTGEFDVEETPGHIHH